MKNKNPMPIMEDSDAYAQRSFNLKESKFKKLKAIALKHDCTWDEKPSVGVMLVEIADGKLKIVKG